MHTFRIWAPGRQSVDVVADGHRLALHQREGGWWEIADVAARAGTRYGYSLDGGDIRPDPRSLSQPDGVLGLSEVIDHSAYAWGDGAWQGRPLAGAVLYELHAGTFSPQGNFEGIVEHLPHLLTQPREVGGQDRRRHAHAAQQILRGGAHIGWSIESPQLLHFRIAVEDIRTIVECSPQLGHTEVSSKRCRQ